MKKSPFTRIATLSISTSLSIALLAACGSVENDQKQSAGNDAHSTSGQKAWEAPEGLNGELTFYSANPQGLTDQLVESFEEKTNVKVNVFSGETGKITAKLQAEEANPQADVVYLASWSAATKQSSSDAFLDYTVTNQADINTSWISHTGDFLGRDGSALALVVNTAATDTVPQDWEDLTQDAFKDKVIMPDPRESGTAADLIAAMVSKWGEEKTWDLFDRLFANGMEVHGANGPALDAVTSGSKAVVFGGVDYSAYTAKAKGEPIEVVIPSSGTTITPRPLMILKTSSNPEAAKAFVNFMLSEEGQGISAKNYMIPAIDSISPAESPALSEIPQFSEDWDSIIKTSGDIREKFIARYL